jgi:hypothetical protein
MTPSPIELFDTAADVLSVSGRVSSGRSEVVQPAAVRPTRSALTCHSRSAAALS